MVYAHAVRPQLESTEDGAPRNGWEQIRHFRYTTTPSERREIVAYAQCGTRTSGSRRSVTCRPTSGPGDAQLELIFGRLQPKGYARESFAGAGWLEFAIVLDEKRRSLVLRDGQLEYVFIEAE